jgi:hypothetical protein
MIENPFAPKQRIWAPKVLPEGSPPTDTEEPPTNSTKRNSNILRRAPSLYFPISGKTVLDSENNSKSNDLLWIQIECLRLTDVIYQPYSRGDAKNEEITSMLVGRNGIDVNCSDGISSCGN